MPTLTERELADGLVTSDEPSSMLTDNHALYWRSAQQDDNNRRLACSVTDLTEFHRSWEALLRRPMHGNFSNSGLSDTVIPGAVLRPFDNPAGSLIATKLTTRQSLADWLRKLVTR